jgi:hypothetical protein
VGARDAASFKHWVGALREAARGGDVEGVQIALAWLVAHGAPRGSIDNAEGDAEGALAAAILESVHIGCDFPMPRLFLSRNTEDGNGRAGQSALGHSVRHGHFAVAQLLIGARRRLHRRCVSMVAEHYLCHVGSDQAVLPSRRCRRGP